MAQRLRNNRLLVRVNPLPSPLPQIEILLRFGIVFGMSLARQIPIQESKFMDSVHS